jgi:putative photosynthetic complex assembly protein 2
MSDIVMPAAYAMFLWWFSTGAVLFLDGLPTRTFRRTMVVATSIFALSLGGLWLTRDENSVAGAYAAFTFGFFAWGWQEISFYLGYITGPRRVACAPGCSGWQHVKHGVLVTVHHEMKILVSFTLIHILTAGHPNRIGLWSFMILWAMHQSAKLNVFLGVQNLTEEFLPEHLQFLKSFLRRRPMNWLFPISVTATTLTAAFMVHLAAAPGLGAFEHTGYVFLTTLLVIGVLEHWFLVMPLPATALWHWGMKSRQRAASRGGDKAQTAPSAADRGE